MTDPSIDEALYRVLAALSRLTESIDQPSDDPKAIAAAASALPRIGTATVAVAKALRDAAPDAATDAFDRLSAALNELDLEEDLP